MDEATTQAIAAGPQALFEHLMGTKYVPAYQEKMNEENARRTDAFADDVTFEVCGEPLRLMTPKDFVWLDGLDNPFVVGGAEAELSDFCEFIWALHALNDPKRPVVSAYRNGRMRNRVTNYMATHDEWDMVAEIYDYIDRVFLEASDGTGKSDDKEKRPPTVHDIAPLVVAAAAAVGPVDPMNGRSLGDTPIPRLIQYQRAAHKNAGGKDAMRGFDSLKSRCLEEVNQIMAEARKGKP